MKKAILFLLSCVAFAALADVYIIDGQRVEGEVHEIDGQRTLCTDTQCFFLPADAVPEQKSGDGGSAAVTAEADRLVSGSRSPAQTAQGYMDADAFLAFLRGDEPTSMWLATNVDGFWTVLGLIFVVLVGGLALNLTPCVLPMIPINLMIIGKSWKRGAAYGLGIALAYGTLGLLAAIGGIAFGTIQGNPWFNAFVALVFVALGLSLLGAFFIDFTRFRFKSGAFVMGALSAVLAGACVAPILISVLLLTAREFAAGNPIYLGLPFVLGLGMALPWPFLAAGLQVLPKPGAWMKWVNRLFAAVVFGFAAYYGMLAYRGFRTERKSAHAVDYRKRLVEATPETFMTVFENLRREGEPVLVDCWASWCKNCAAMEETTFQDRKVLAELDGWAVIKLQAEKMGELRALPGFGEIRGLPAFVIFK